MRLLEDAEIQTFDPAVITDDFLTENGLLAVGLGYPYSQIEANLQSNVVVTMDGVVVPACEGVVLGYPTTRAAVGSAIKQIAYIAGLPPGHAGVHLPGEGEDYIVLASEDAKDAYRRRDDHDERVGRHTGYVALACSDLFSSSATENWRTPFTRRPTPYKGIYGLNLGVVDRVLGGEGLAGLQAPADHPVVREHLIAARLLTTSGKPQTIF